MHQEKWETGNGKVPIKFFFLLSPFFFLAMPLILPITPDDQRRLLPLLAERGTTILERQSLLESAGLAILLPKIDLNTSAEQFATQAIRVAQRHGAITPTVPALVPLLKQLREAYAGQAEAASFLDTLVALPPTEAELPEEAEEPPTIENDITDVDGDVIIANVVVDKESKVTPDITVGKNIIKIGKIVIPIWMFVVAIALPFVVAGGAYFAFVPAKMPNNAAQFNVAVAPFGELRNGQVEDSATAELLSQWVAEGLTQEKPVYEAAFGNPIEVWHDGLSPLIKRTTIGIIEGSNEQIRQGNAEERANDINANVIIYGVLEPQADGSEALTIEFYVKPDLSTPIESRFGHEQMGDPIRLPIAFNPNETGTGNSAAVWETVINRGRSLAWIIRTLDRERRGLKSEMIAVIDRAEAAANSTESGRLRWPERGAGKEVIYTLKGEAELELAYADRACGEESRTRTALAESAFQKAIASNEAYALAQVGLGNVAQLRAQCLLTIPPIEAADIKAAEPLVTEALRHYQTAQTLAPNAADAPYINAVAALAVAPAYRLQALIALQRAQLEPDQQAEWYRQAAQSIEAGEIPLIAVIQNLPDDEYYYRLLARAYLVRGNLLSLNAYLLNLQANESGYKTALTEAITAYSQCEAQANKVFADVYLKEILIPQFCTPQKESNQALLEQAG
jgi:hypothetical protein